nr:N-acetylmuramoyl-L-alanine amidase [Sporocytophaga myxococcoides]
MAKKFLSIGFCLTLLLFSFTPLERRSLRVKTIVIDPGHGGKDPGCMKNKTKEKDIALDISLKVGQLIQENMPDVKVIFTRKDDRFVELHDRAGIANKNHADLFISVHVNSGPAGMHGTETYCMGLHKTEQNLEIAQRENSSILMEDDHKENYEGFDPNSPQSYILFSLYQNAFMHSSMKLAHKIETEFKQSNKRHSRGVKQAGFLVLWKTSMPSVLVETGFITDTADFKILNSESGRFDSAWGIYSAIEDYKKDIESVGLED